MAIDMTALYCCLDDFCKVFEDWEAHRLILFHTCLRRTRFGLRARCVTIRFVPVAMPWHATSSARSPPRHENLLRAFYRRMCPLGPQRMEEPPRRSRPIH